ncbi:MAG: hypothetical protein ACK46M_24340, partial [Planctomyces sp.]
MTPKKRKKGEQCGQIKQSRGFVPTQVPTKQNVGMQTEPHGGNHPSVSAELPPDTVVQEQRSQHQQCRVHHPQPHYGVAKEMPNRQAKQESPNGHHFNSTPSIVDLGRSPLSHQTGHSPV